MEKTRISRALRSAITFLMGCAIFVGLPILGWGPMDIPGLLNHPARVAFLAIVLVLNAYAAIRIPEIGKQRGTDKETVRRQHAAVVLLQVFSIALVVAAPYSDHRHLAVMGDRDVLRYAGLVLYAIGFLAMHFAEAHLGHEFSLEVRVKEGHRLVTDGPYRHLRHPRYAGMILFAAGIALVFVSWVGLVCAAAMTAVLFWRIRDEEELMHREFAADWERYAERTWRIVPFLY